MAISRIESNSIAPSQTLTTPIIATTMGVGGATPSGSGSGITFPAVLSASSDANTLDDYEEGTFTPVFSRSGGTPSLTYGFQGGAYTRIGNLVYVSLLIVISGVSSQGGSGNILVDGFPFTSGGGNTYSRVMTIGYNDVFDDQAVTRGWMNSASMYIMPSGVTQAAYNGNFTTGYFAVAGSYIVA